MSTEPSNLCQIEHMFSDKRAKVEMSAVREEIHFSPEDQHFIDRATDFCQRMGERAVLMLVGSRAANFADEWSDLDLCIIGDKRCLSDEDRRTYERSQQLFVDRGDYEAHWSFFDEGDLRAWLETWPSEMMWIISTSRTLYGCSNTAEELKHHYCLFPPAVAESKLKWLFGKYYYSQRGPLAMAARKHVEMAFVASLTDSRFPTANGWSKQLNGHNWAQQYIPRFNGRSMALGTFSTLRPTVTSATGCR